MLAWAGLLGLFTIGLVKDLPALLTRAGAGDERFRTRRPPRPPKNRTRCQDAGRPIAPEAEPADCDELWINNTDGATWKMLGDWIDAGPEAEIPEFVAGEDRLLVALSAADLQGAVITLGADDETGVTQILLNGAPIAQMPPGTNLTPDRIHLTVDPGA